MIDFACARTLPRSKHILYMTACTKCEALRLGEQSTAPSFCFVFAVARCTYCVPEYATMHSLSVHYFLNMHWLRVYNRSLLRCSSVRIAAVACFLSFCRTPL